MVVNSQEVHLQGVPISRGIAIGKSYFFAPMEPVVPEYEVEESDLQKELRRFRRATTKSSNELQKLRKRLEAEGALEGSAIIDAHLQMLQDPLLTTAIEQGILDGRRNAESVFWGAVQKHVQRFQTLEDSFFRERAKDLFDIARRVLKHLGVVTRCSGDKVPDGAVAFSQELSVSDTAEAQEACVAAFLTEGGGAMAHAAIVAKARGLPYVSGVDIEVINSHQGSTVIVDGRTGTVIVEPTPATLSRYTQMRQRLNSQFQLLEQDGRLAAETYDGHTVRVSANIEMVHELELLHRYGGSGVGLFRSEFMFLAKASVPSESEQFEVYKLLAERAEELPLVIRTFDIGGDKIPLASTPQEDNPLLGCRATRYMLQERDIFKAQLRAILRASQYGHVCVMFPMISGIQELRDAKTLLALARQELIDEGIPVRDHVPVGCMIEVPSAAILADLLAAECDFLSIGTNDLVQYALAAARGGQGLNHYYEPMHPSVVRLIRTVVIQANRHQVPVTVCGELAGDPRFAPLLLGLGVHELSVAARMLPFVKHAIRSFSLLEATEMADSVLQMCTSDEIEAFLTKRYRENVPDDHFFNW